MILGICRRCNNGINSRCFFNWIFNYVKLDSIEIFLILWQTLQTRDDVKKSKRREANVVYINYADWLTISGWMRCSRGFSLARSNLCQHKHLASRQYLTRVLNEDDNECAALVPICFILVQYCYYSITLRSCVSKKWTMRYDVVGLSAAADGSHTLPATTGVYHNVRPVGLYRTLSATL